MQKNANFDGYGKQGLEANLTPLPLWFSLKTGIGRKFDTQFLFLYLVEDRSYSIVYYYISGPFLASFVSCASHSFVKASARERIPPKTLKIVEKQVIWRTNLDSATQKTPISPF